MRTLILATIVATALLAARGSTAVAYPQYQLSHDATCTGCHISPAGGGLLSENGFLVAEAESWKGGDPQFLHGVSLADWIQLGGDARGAAGAVDNGALGAAAYPMQAELRASAGGHGFTFNATGGLRRPQSGGSVVHALWSREHYLMWQQKPGATEGLYLRAGRFMPVYGLRLAEHIAYTQRFGGEPLYGEAYGAAVEYVTRPFEVHATGFVHDSIGSAVEHGDGAALYAEARIGEHAAIGGEAKYASDNDQHRTYAGLIGKLYIPGSNLLFQAEAELVHNSLVTGGSYNQLLGQVLATHPLAQGWLLDVGIGHYTQDTAVKGNYRESIDINVHWFLTSHLEALATTRIELLDRGSGPNGGYALAQVHYRL